MLLHRTTAALQLLPGEGLGYYTIDPRQAQPAVSGKLASCAEVELGPCYEYIKNANNVQQAVRVQTTAKTAVVVPFRRSR